MPSIISPAVTPNVPSQPASHSAPRGRPTEEAQGRSFGEALERSRAASALKTHENPDALPLEPVARQKPSRNGDKKDDLPADLQAMALLAPAPAPAPDTNLLTKAVIAAQGMAQEATPLSQQEAPAQAGAAQPVLPQDADRVEATFVSGDGAQAIDGMRRAPVQDSMNTERKTPLDTRVGAPFDEHLDQAAAAGPLASPPTLALMPAATDRPSAPVGQTPALSVHPVVGGSEWGPALGQQMIRMSTSGHHVAELSLNPAGLGPLKVTLTIGDNQAQALFVSAHEGVRNAIEAALPQLRKTLADHGINLGQTSVGAESQQPPRQGGTFGQHPSGRSTPPDYPGPDRLDTVAIAEPLLTGLPSALRRPSAGVDTFA